MKWTVIFNLSSLPNDTKCIVKRMSHELMTFPSIIIIYNSKFAKTIETAWTTGKVISAG